MTNPQQPLYRRLAEVGNEVADVVPLIVELQEELLAGNSSEPRTAEEGYWSADGCLEKLASRDRQSAIALAYWLTNDALVDCGKRLFRLRDRHNFREGEPPSAVDVSGLDPGMVALCACRLSALAISPAQSLAWTLAIAATAKGPEDLLHTAAVALLRYHIEEFPRTTLQLLSNRPEEYKEVRLAKDAAEHLQKQDDELDALARLPEFSMSLSMRIALADRKRRESRQIERGAARESLLASLFTQQHFKYAHTTAIEMRLGDQVREQPLAMAPYSVSLELPLSEVIDPQMGLVRRERLWTGRLE